MIKMVEGSKNLNMDPGMEGGVSMRRNRAMGGATMKAREEEEGLSMVMRGVHLGRRRRRRRGTASPPIRGRMMMMRKAMDARNM